MTAPITPALSFPLGRPTGRPVNDVARAFGSMFQGRTGIWYDPQDLTTFYQDAAGTLPVYRPGSGAVDPPVGLMLDKSKGLELGPELITNGDFSDGATGWTIDVKSSIVDGRLFFTESGNVSKHPAYQAIDATPGSVVRVSFSVELISGRYMVFMGLLDGSGVTVTILSHTYTSKEFVAYCYIPSGFMGGIRFRNEDATTMYIDNVSCREVKGYHAYQSTTTARPTLSGRYNLLTATETLSTQSITTVATNYTLSFSGAGTVTLSGTAKGTYSAGTHTITCTAGTLTCTVSGTVTRADLRVANDGVGLPPYQRVGSATTYDTAGFPLYLRFDGVDDFLQTANVDLTGTDEVTTGTGARSNLNQTAAVIFEMGTNADSLDKNFNNYFTPTQQTIKMSAPATAALSTQTTLRRKIVGVANADRSAGTVKLTANGVVATASNTFTTVPLGSLPLYIGARAGASYFLNGQIYALCIIGGLLSTSEQAVLERYLNAKTRAY